MVETKQKLDIDSLTEKQRESVVQAYFGVHPKYFVFINSEIKVNLIQMAMDGVEFKGFKCVKS